MLHIMRTLQLFLVILLLQTTPVSGQRYMVTIPVTQQDPRIHVTLMYQEKNSAFGAMTQDYRITVKNNTSDKLKVHLEYEAVLTCGTQKKHQLGPLGDGITIAPSQTVGKPYATDGIGSAVRLTESACAKDSWRVMGKEESGSTLYSMISSVSYRIVRIENLSEKDRAAAELKRKKQEELLQKKKQDDELTQQRNAEGEHIAGTQKNVTSSTGIKSKNTASAGLPQSDNASQDAVSGKVKVNGEYVQVFRSNGIPFIKRADGTVHQTTETAFTQISQAAGPVSGNGTTSLQEEFRQVPDEKLKREETERVLAQLERDRLQQQAANRQLEEAVTGVTNQFAQAMMNDAREKERRYERDQLRREQRDAEAYKIVRQYEKRADQGDETAIAHMIQAQYLLSSGNPVEYMKNKRVTFGSQAATDGLINHFQQIITTTDQERAGNFLSSILYIAGGAGAYFLLNSLSADEPEAEGTDLGMKDVYLAGAYGVGGTLGLVGMISAVRGFTARGSDYRNAVKELSLIKSNTDLTFGFTPAVFRHQQTHAVGFAFKVNF